jgi:hypothetical protein
MKKLALLFLFLTVSLPLAAAKKYSVAELQQILSSMQQSSDAKVAAFLKDVELTEELPSRVRNQLHTLFPGPQCSAQLNQLTGRSAFLAPAASEIPQDAALEADKQHDLLANAMQIATRSNTESPHLQVNKITARFQDANINSSEIVGSNIAIAYPDMLLTDIHSETIENDKGVEKPAPSKAQTQWGANGLVSEGNPPPASGVLLQDIQSAGKIAWLRWEMIGGKKVAVFNFFVDRKNSHYLVDYCCFSQIDTIQNNEKPLDLTGFYPGTRHSQSVSAWKPFRKATGYRGQIYLDPDTGALVRLLLHADLKPSDVVLQENLRIDYGSFSIGGKKIFLPVNSYATSEVLPNGDQSLKKDLFTHPLFMNEYRNYRLAQP